jgi:hypothetical protein
MAGVNCNIECPKGIGELKKIIFTNSFGYFAISQANICKVTDQEEKFVVEVIEENATM